MKLVRGRVLHRTLRVKRRHRMTGMSLLRVRSGFLHCLSEHGTWKTREQEILGFAGYVRSLRSWVALASDTFGWELESALSWPHELHMTNLNLHSNFVVPGCWPS